jgi:hypothetical protein
MQVAVKFAQDALRLAHALEFLLEEVRPEFDKALD